MKRKRRKWTLPPEVQLPKVTIDAFLARVLERSGPEDHAIAGAHVETVHHLLDVLADKNSSIKRLRRMVFGPTSEKASEILQGHAHNEEAGGREGGKRKGHGRNGVSEYPGAKRIHVPHATLRPGDECPGCHRGKVYRTGRDGVEPRITGRPMLEVIIWEPECLRCSLCGEVFRAELPPGAGTKKLDETAASVVALLKYGTGMPFRRFATLQKGMGVPLPAANQWELVREAAQACAPAHEELQRQAARGDVLQNDDTRMKILGRKKEGEPEGGAKNEVEGKDKGKGKKKRKGVVTTGIVSKVKGHTVVLYATGRRQAGENLAEVLKKRPKELGTPIQMADGHDANTPKGFATILANCNAHARRKFVEILPMFPQECREVIEAFRKVYHNDDLTRDMPKEERLRFHQEHSGPVMKTLKEWLEAQLREKKVEPNSRLGKAFSYVLDRWQRLSRFLEVAGTPLDNNLTERILKLAILHRKNALYYRTERGASVGDIFMSLIQTARMNGANPFEYLTALQRNAAAVRERPEEWLPWNFMVTLAAIEDRRAGGKGPATGPAGSEKIELRDTG